MICMGATLSTNAAHFHIWRETFTVIFYCFDSLYVGQLPVDDAARMVPVILAAQNLSNRLP